MSPPCPISGAKRKTNAHVSSSAFDPKQPIQDIRSTSALGRQSGLVLLVVSSSGCDPNRSSTRSVFAYRDLWNIGGRLWDHSALMLAARITLAHFSVSSAINLPKSADEPGIAVLPRSANRALILGSARAALISLLSTSMISGGVLLGTAMPSQLLAS